MATDYVEAVKWYRKAGEQGVAEAQFTLGWRYYKGDGVTKDVVEAVKWYRKAAAQGVAHAEEAANLIETAFLQGHEDRRARKKVDSPLRSKWSVRVARPRSIELRFAGALWQA